MLTFLSQLIGCLCIRMCSESWLYFRLWFCCICCPLLCLGSVSRCVFPGFISSPSELNSLSAYHLDINLTLDKISVSVRVFQAFRLSTHIWTNSICLESLSEVSVFKSFALSFLPVSDSCFRNLAEDRSGVNLKDLVHDPSLWVALHLIVWASDSRSF